MITKIKYEQRGETNIAKFVGLSTDDKTSIDDAVNGSEFYEMDSGKTAFYDAEGDQWLGGTEEESGS